MKRSHFIREPAQGQRTPMGSPGIAGVGETQHGSPRKDASVQVGKDTPQQIKKDFGRPRRRYVDFLLLIGALRWKHTHNFRRESPSRVYF